MSSNCVSATRCRRGRCTSSTNQNVRGSKRRGAVLVEFALVAPILLLVLLGMIEVGRGIMVTEVLGHAARSGARAASLPHGTSSSVTTTVNDLMTGAELSGYTLQVLVNGVESDLSTVKSGDEISVRVSIPYANVTWVGNPRYLDGKTLGGQCVMRRE